MQGSFQSGNGSNDRRATVLTAGVIFGSMVGMGVLALAVDTGLMYTARQELQNAADSAALAGAAKIGAIDDADSVARAEAAAFASLNDVARSGAWIDVQQDVVFGRAVPNGAKFDFTPNAVPANAVNISVRRNRTVADGAISLLFARALGISGAELTANATAMIVPRDVALVVDLSESMNNDSEIRHYKDYLNNGEYHDPVQVNLEDIWTALPVTKGNNGVGNGIDPQPPGNPTNYNDQPGTGPGTPNSKGGNPNPGANPSGGTSGQSGPRWGWMTGWGSSLAMDAYSPSTDTGLYYIPRNLNTTDTEIVANLVQAGYSSAERTVLLSGSSDNNITTYKNRVKILLGLAAWRSGKAGGKFTTGPGNGNNVINPNEMHQEVHYQVGGGSWDEFIDYVSSSTTAMAQTDSQFRYRYGLKTMVNYLLEQQAGHSGVSDLAAAPEMPLAAVKSATQNLVDRMIEKEFDDHLSLETFDLNAHHELNLTVPDDHTSLAEALQTIPDRLNTRQAAYYGTHTNIGAALNQAINELSSDRARSDASKLIVLVTTGRPNVDQSFHYVGDGDQSAADWALNRAQYAKDHGITIYCVGVGDGVDSELLEQIASNPSFYTYLNGEADPGNYNMPGYVAQIDNFLEDLGSAHRGAILIR